MTKKFLALLTKAAFVLSIACASFAVLAVGDPWTAVGSSGSVDEDDQDEVDFYSNYARIAFGAPANSSVTLRYNITSTADLDDGGVNKVLKVRYLDNGDNSRIVIKLRSYSINSGSTATLLSFDSNDYSGTSYQSRTVGDGCWKPSFDFQKYAYYIEATLSRTSTTGIPVLAALQVSDIDIC